MTRASEADAAVGENWSHSYTYRARRLVEPESLDEARKLVASSSRIRALGSRHSFNDIADTPGDLLSLARVPPDIRVDREAMTVTAGAGIKYGTLAQALQGAGLALHNLGSLPHISIGGATATGTHGSGLRNGNLSSAITGLELIGREGDVEWIDQGHPEFDASRIALGALGIVARIRLAVESSYQVRQERYLGITWATALRDPHAVFGAAYSVSLFTNWLGDAFEIGWFKWRADALDGDVPDELFGGYREPEGSHIMLDHDNMTVRGGVIGPWSERLPHFRFDATPSNGDEIQTEYFVPLDVLGHDVGVVRLIGGWPSQAVWGRS